MKDRIIDAIGKIDDDMIESVDTIRYKEENNIKPVWVRWVAVAACFALVAVFGIGGFQRGLFETKNETVAMENGESITFVKGNVPMASLDMNMTSRAMNNEEINLLFANLPVTANVFFDAETRNAVGLEGKIGNGRLIVSINGVNLSDTVIEGHEYTSTINGVDVNAGYFVTKANSKGIKTSIYYATVKIGENDIYVEFAGDERESEALKIDLANCLQKVIENGEFDLSIICE